MRAAKPVLPVSSTKMLTGALLPGLAGDGRVAGVDEERPQPVDVPLGDAVGRVERQRRLVVLARGAELAELPERLGEPVLGLDVRAHLEDAPVRLGGRGPIGGGRLGDGLLGQLALEADLAGRGRFAGLDFGEGHGGGSSFRACANGAVKDALVRTMFIASRGPNRPPVRRGAGVAVRVDRRAGRMSPRGRGVPNDARRGIIPRSAAGQHAACALSSRIDARRGIAGRRRWRARHVVHAALYGAPRAALRASARPDEPDPHPVMPEGASKRDGSRPSRAQIRTSEHDAPSGIAPETESRPGSRTRRGPDTPGPKHAKVPSTPRSPTGPPPPGRCRPAAMSRAAPGSRRRRPRRAP